MVVGSRSCLQAAPTPDGEVQICNGTGSQLGQSTLSREFIVTVEDPADGQWTVSLIGDSVPNTDSHVDAWMAQGFSDADRSAAFTLGVTSSETISIPGTSDDAITVASHTTKMCWSDQENVARQYATSVDSPTRGALPRRIGDLSFFSGLGPTRTAAASRTCPPAEKASYRCCRVIQHSRVRW